MKIILKSLALLSALLIMSCQNTSENSQLETQKNFKVSGKIFRLNTDEMSFDLLKETAVDPTSNEGKSRYNVQYSNETEFIEVIKQNNFRGIEGEHWAYVYNLDRGKLDQANVKKAKSGDPFLSLHATVLKKGEDPSAYEAKSNSVIGLFTPENDSPHYRKATIELDGKKIPFRLRGPRAQVEIRKSIKVEDIAADGWETELSVKIVEGQWIAQEVEVTRRPDPREVDDPKLPRILVIGDSISMNYHQAAKDALGGIANYYRNDGNAGPSDRGALCIDLWVGDVQQPGLHWDVIQFNFGLHDLKQMYDEPSEEYGAYQLPLDEYKNNLRTVITKLKKTGAKLMWCTTTPVPNSSIGRWGNKVMGRRKDEDLVFNKAALEVILEHPEIQVNDINSFIRKSQSFNEWRKGKDVHFWGKDLQELVGKAVAHNLQKVLK
jgi:hypothetical protein